MTLPDQMADDIPDPDEVETPLGVAYVDIDALFGHIADAEIRAKRADEYAAQLQDGFAALEPGDVPILPREVVFVPWENLDRTARPDDAD